MLLATDRFLNINGQHYLVLIAFSILLSSLKSWSTGHYFPAIGEAGDRLVDSELSSGLYFCADTVRTNGRTISFLHIRIRVKQGCNWALENEPSPWILPAAIPYWSPLPPDARLSVIITVSGVSGVATSFDVLRGRLWSTGCDHWSSCPVWSDRFRNSKSLLVRCSNPRRDLPFVFRAAAYWYCSQSTADCSSSKLELFKLGETKRQIGLSIRQRSRSISVTKIDIGRTISFENLGYEAEEADITHNYSYLDRLAICELIGNIDRYWLVDWH